MLPRGTTQSVKDATTRRRLFRSTFTLILPVALVCILWLEGSAFAIDFYEIQIYPTETTPERVLQLELHSNSVTTATGELAHSQLNPYQVHETLEATYGLTPHIEIGQYFATAKLSNGEYEYAGSRTKVHFGVAESDSWPLQIGGNIELDYMRRAAEDNPFSLELRPIVEKRSGGPMLVTQPPFQNTTPRPGTHKGMTFTPAGEIS